MAASGRLQSKPIDINFPALVERWRETYNGFTPAYAPISEGK